MASMLAGRKIIKYGSEFINLPLLSNPYDDIPLALDKSPPRPIDIQMVPFIDLVDSR